MSRKHDLVAVAARHSSVTDSRCACRRVLIRGCCFRRLNPVSDAGLFSEKWVNSVSIVTPTEANHEVKIVKSERACGRALMIKFIILFSVLATVIIFAARSERHMDAT
jgi:hypothetical protein